MDIDVHLGGADTTVRDVFETDGARITSLCVRGFAGRSRRGALRIAPGNAPEKTRLGRGAQAGVGCGPRSRRPGRSPVASSCWRTTTPDLTVAA